jgi:hypothetical protein
MPILLDDAPLLPLKVETLWAFIASDERGDEGLPAATVGDVLVPLIAADPARVESLRDIAQMLADNSRRAITLYKFTGREKVEIIQPRHRSN